MAVPTSGAISLRGVARERAYPNGNGPSIDAYSQGTIPPGPISMYDVMRGGNTNGSGYNYCPPMTNVFTVNGFNVEKPYDPNLEQGSGYLATPYAMSEFRGHIGNRELGCMKVNNNTNCYPTGTTTFGSAPAAGQSHKLEFDLNYTPTGTGAIITLSITVNWAGLSTSVDYTGGSGSQLITFTATKGTHVYYLNMATNTGSARSLDLSVYIAGSCYSTNYLNYDITAPQLASNGSGSGGGSGGLGEGGGGGEQ